MTPRFVGIDPNTGGEGADALLKSLVGSTEWVAGHKTVIPQHERVIRIPFRMVQILTEACDGTGDWAPDGKERTTDPATVTLCHAAFEAVREPRHPAREVHRPGPPSRAP